MTELEKAIGDAAMAPLLAYERWLRERIETDDGWFEGTWWSVARKSQMRYALAMVEEFKQAMTTNGKKP
jgi:hypothetical protein